MFDSINWGTVIVAIILALIAAAVPITLSTLLNRKNANKKLNLDETTVMLTGTKTQIETYQDLLKRADDAVTKAEAITSTLAARVTELESTKDDQIWQIKILRNLFRQVVSRSNITLTTEEQEAFDSTKPATEIRKINRTSPA